MKFDVRYANHPDDSKRYDTAELRKKYLIEKLFEEDEILLTYSHQDRIIAGGAMPVKKTLSLGTFKELATDYFLEVILSPAEKPACSSQFPCKRICGGDFLKAPRPL